MKNNLRYGIRKHKLGAASVFLGTMIVVGMGQDKEAAASEQKTTTVEENGNSATDNKVSETQVEVAQPRTALESKPRVTRSTDVAEAKEASDAKVETGTDVTSKVTVEDESKIEAPKGNNVQPHEGQRVVLKYKLKFQDGLKTGDYFDFTLSNNVNTHGVATTRKVPDIKNGSLVMAKGQVLDNGRIRYTFTDYIKDKVNVTANLEINLFIDPKTVQSNGQQTITSKLNGKETSGTMQITYKDGVKNQYTNVNGSIETFDKEKNKFTHVAYIKPINGNNSDSVTVTGMLTQGSNENGTQPNVKIYEYVGVENGLPQSVYANTVDSTQLKDVTNQMGDKLKVQNNGSYSLNFDKLDKTYVIHYTGDYLNGTSEVNFRTQLTGYPENRYKTYYYYNNGYTLTWDNGLVLYSNKANGDGKYGPIVDSNNFEFSEDSGNGSISGQYDAKQIIETEENQDNTPLDIDYHTAIDGEGGYVDGYIETIEETDSSAIDIDYHTAVDSEAGHVGGYTESSEESNPIDFEESTHENSKHHADVVEYEEDTNPGGGQVTTESNLVEFDEESTKGIVTGAVSDHTTVEDTKEYTTESNLIELVDELPEEHGQAQGPVEEITENNHHISHSGLGTENGHGNYGVIEEIEENSHVDIKSELGYEGGQNSGNQSFEEDTEEDKPKYEQGGNIIDIDFDSVPQIHGFNKHNEIIEEDTNKDKPNYQFGGHNSVDFEEDTLPKVSGQNEGQQTIEEDTTPPTPPTPEVPSEPGTPTPPTPEVPSEPGKPTPPTPEVPAEPGKPVPPAKEEPKKPSKPVEQGKVVTPVIEINEKVKAVAPTKQKQAKKSELPETGGEESTNKGMLFGGLFSILGLALLRRNKKNHKA
ncbi:fibronectin-binding protein [Staphylococcus aureus]|uniref:fibrinogen-binding adhesin SdrG C-terminal domain-containing protein n=1 Tax=Staphylococcus aureus TaxID=1280 RepID=UPI000DA953C2|nr:fibrinogen-binding adhesin SdrG C-terminal domain-containing protein [Staphylococcus aureus]PZG58891.1 fibronectin-binding protein [Staphylococcus aureus]